MSLTNYVLDRLTDLGVPNHCPECTSKALSLTVTGDRCNLGTWAYLYCEICSETLFFFEQDELEGIFNLILADYTGERIYE